MLLSGAGVFFSAGIATATRVDTAVAEAPLAAVVVEPAVATTTTSPPTTATALAPGSPDQWFRPSGRNEGTEGIVNGLAALALRDNPLLYLSDTWGRTSGSGLSDHHVSQTGSWAGDLAVRGIQVPTPSTRLAAQRIGAALGEPNWPGGTLVRTIQGYRIQVLWLVDGHHNHVHVGVRKVG